MSLALELVGVSKSFGATRVLEDVALTVPEGEVLGIIGPNGGGKTVLLKIMLGLLRADRGTVRVLGCSPEKARGEVGYVPQFASFDNQFPINVLDMVLQGRLGRKRLLRMVSAQDRERALDALCSVKLQDLAGRQIGKLSGGQLQRALIARALVGEPRILLLDEPTASLDPEIGSGVYELLSKLRKHMTVAIVSHDVGVISSYVTSIACVNRRLFHHQGGHVPREFVEAAYGCPVHFVPVSPSDAPDPPCSCGKEHD